MQVIHKKMMLGGDTAYCKWCGTAFTTTREHKVFCSCTCEDAERKEYKAEKAKGETPGNVLEPVIRICRTCGAPFVTTHEGRRYCSDRCRYRKEHVRKNGTVQKVL